MICCGACGVVCAGGVAKGEPGAGLGEGKGFREALSVAGLVGVEDCAGCGIVGLASTSEGALELCGVDACCGASCFGASCSCGDSAGSCFESVGSCLGRPLGMVSDASLLLKSDPKKLPIDVLLVICVDIRTRSIRW